MSGSLLIMIVLLVVGAPIVYAVGKRSTKAAGWIAFIFSLISLTIFSLSVVPAVLKENLYVERYTWAEMFGAPFLTFGLRADNLSTPIVGMILLLCTLATLYSIEYMSREHNQELYFALLLLYIAGMVGVVLATNLVQFYIFWEIMLIPSWLLVARWGTSEKAQLIAFKYFMFTHLGAICIILGIAATWSLTATFDLYATEMVSGIAAAPASTLKLIVALFMLGFAVKMALFPLHSWLPDTYSEAPTPISVILSGVMSECGVYAIARILLTFFGTTFVIYTTTFMTIAVITMIYGGVLALAQKDFKRMLAYSSISQMGYMFLGLAAGTATGISGSMFHIVNHAISKGLLFMVAGVLMHQIDQIKGRDMDKLGGLAGKMPITATITLIAGLSMAGVPPLSGFVSEVLIFAGAFIAASGAGSWSIPMLILAVIAVISTVITAGYILWMIRRVFFGPPREEFENVKEPPLTMLAPMALLAFLAILLGFYPDLVLRILVPAAEEIEKLIGG
ncbi:MAG: complex I subunit 4 family protein [Candidatus Baldrarchaeia archaeon]